MEIGKLGLWSPIDGMTSPELAQFAKAVEEAGYAAWWIPEGFWPQFPGRGELDAGQYDQAHRRNGHRQHLCARRHGDGRRARRAE